MKSGDRVKWLRFPRAPWEWVYGYVDSIEGIEVRVHDDEGLAWTLKDYQVHSV